MTTSRSPAPADSVTHIRLGAAVIVAAGLLAYANTFSVPFIFDDAVAVTHNPSIRHLGSALFPPETAGSAAGRPLVNLSFALNYAIGGERVAGYHAVNLLIHLAAALALFGFVRRTLQLPRLQPRWGAAALPVAFCSTLLWTVHPLLTESVTCIAQRTELLVGLWYLLMFYCLARAAEPAAPARWRTGAFIACLLGMASKEVMVAAPVLAALYYTLLVDGSWRATWAQRGKFLGLLALTWVPLVLLVALNGPRRGAGFGQGIAWWEYALTQCHALMLYVRLAFWPHPLVLDYGRVVLGLGEVWPQAVGLTALLAAVAMAWLRKLPVAFAGLWFFFILAPSSSVLPLVTQTIAEHRMYLPLAAIIVPLVATVHALAGRRSLFAFVILAVLLAGLTWQRNAAYASPLAIWQDTAAKAPNNARAHNNLGNTFDETGREDEAARAYERALALEPDYAEAHYNFGNLLARQNRPAEAIDHFRASLRAEPGDATTHAKLGVLLVQVGRRDEGIAELLAALRLAPDHSLAREELVRLGHELPKP